MDTEALKAKLSLMFEIAASCSNCRSHFDIEKYRSAGIDVSNFGNVKDVCRNQNRLSSLHLKGEDEDGFIAIYECPKEDICEHWRPVYNSKYIDSKLTNMEIYLEVENKKDKISDDDVAQLAKDLGYGSINES